MTVATAPSSHSSSVETVADLLDQLGGIPPERIRMCPAPGTATEQDAEQAESRTGKICELIDRVLVEKVMGTYESAVAITLSFFLKMYHRRVRPTRTRLWSSAT